MFEQSPTTGSTKPARAPRWHLLYFALGALDLLAVSSSLYISHHIARIYQETTALNEAWDNREARLTDLAEAATILNAPGNDVFDSRDVPGESRRFNEARARFEAALAAAVADLTSSVAPATAGPLLGDLRAVAGHVDKLVGQAQAIFRHMGAGRLEQAGSHMAGMDRAFALASGSLSDAGRKVRAIKQENRLRQMAQAESVRRLEYLIAALMVVMVCGVGGYGCLLSRRIRSMEEARERSDRSVRRSEERMRMLMARLPVGVFETDAQGECTYVNARLGRMTGLAEEALQGRRWAQAIDPRDRDHVVQSWFETARRGSDFDMECRLRTERGGSRWTHVRASPVRNGAGVITSYLGTVTDITARREAQDRLRESEERMRAVVRTAPDGILTVDEQGRIESINPAGEEIFGYAADEVVGKEITLLLPTPEGETCDSLTLGFVGSAREVVGRRKNGDAFPLDIAVSATQLQNRCVFIGIVRDITGRKQAEEAIRRHARDLQKANGELEAQREELEALNQELNHLNAHLEKAGAAAESASRAKSAFLANMSHEIRTPMTAILGFTETLLESDVSEEERVAAVKTIRRNGEHLLQVINDILDLSRIEADRLEVERVRTSPLQLVSEVVSLMQVRAAPKGIALNAEYLGPVPETILTDPTRLRQVLVNVVGNSIKFTETGGVRVIVTYLADHAAGPAMQFDVVDTGIGLDAEQAARLFQPFSQADVSTSRRFGGTGLGLTISRRLAQLLGGELILQATAPGQGSTFRLVIAAGTREGVRMVADPARAAVTVPEAGSAPSEMPSLDCRVLLAEDGLDNQRLLTHILRKAGAETKVVDNGRAAVEAALAAVAAGRPFDVILMDMQMPVMDGYEAARRLRQEGYRRPIIALTAHAMTGDREKCLRAGCDDFATKPVDRRKFLETVRAYSQRGAATASA